MIRCQRKFRLVSQKKHNGLRVIAQRYAIGSKANSINPIEMLDTYVFQYFIETEFITVALKWDYISRHDFEFNFFANSRVTQY